MENTHICRHFANLGKKTWPPGDVAYFPYIYIENFKNLLIKNYWTDFNITLQECFLADPVPRLFKSLGFVKKTWSLGTGAYFPNTAV